MSHELCLSQSVMSAQNVLVREAACHFHNHPSRHPQERLPSPEWDSMIIDPSDVRDDSDGAHREVSIRAQGALKFGGEVNVSFNVNLLLFKPKGEKQWTLKKGTGRLSEPNGKFNWTGNDCPNGGGASTWASI